MNLVATSTILALFASGATAQGDTEVSAAKRPFRRHNTHMWMFGENGVSIFTPDGSEEVKTIQPEQVCKNVTSSYDESGYRIRCDFNDVVSDGNKYVWASVARGVPLIDVFRIDTGDLVGSFGTCGSPRDLDFHPLREEIWVHCSEFSNISQSHMDVFSSVSPTASIPTSITMHDNTNMRSYGKLEVHASLGDVAYSTVSGQPTLYKIDLAERSVMEEIDVSPDDPKFYGIYDIAYSPKNGHIFARTEVCCTCGFEGADNFECGHYGSYNITIAGELTEGQCGRHCRGGPTDNIGIIEFDTKTDTVVGTHQFSGSAPVYAPFASPDGEHIILFGLDGGKTVEILKAGANGQKSQIETILALDFNLTNVDDDNVFNDFAYIQHEDKNLFVVSSASDYKVAIVDMNSPDKYVSYVMLKDIPYDDRDRSRQVEWAEGTNYVWIGGRQDDEAYVVDVVNKELVKTFTGVDSRKLLSVTPHHFMGMADEYAQQIGKTTGMYSSSSSMSSGSGTGENNNSLSIAALALSVVAIAAVAASFFARKAVPAGAQEAAPLAKAIADDPSLAVPPSVA